MTKISDLLTRLDVKVSNIQKTLDTFQAELKEQERRIRKLERFTALVTGGVIIFEFLVKH
jgi:archaellum component FlaC